MFTSNAANPSPGDWKGIYFTDHSYDPCCVLEGCTIEYGGGEGANIYCYQSSPTIQNCTIRNSATEGVYAAAVSNPLISDCAIYDNAGYAVRNGTSAVTIAAENNWWGDPSGPYHPQVNPNGLGDQVTDYVDFEPWLGALPAACDSDNDGVLNVDDSCPNVYNPDQIDSDYDPSVVALWHFCEGSRTTVYDETAYHNDGTIYGAEWTNGKFCQGLSFPSAGQTNSDGAYVLVPHSESLDITGPLSVEAWIKVAGDDPHATVVQKCSGNGAGINGYSLCLDDGRVSLSIYNGTMFRSFVGLTDLRDSTWHYVAGVWNGEESTVYVDGVPESTWPWAYPPGTSSNDLEIGESTDGGQVGSAFLGTIDEVRISNVGRTPADILKCFLASREHRLGDSFGDSCDNCPAVYNPSQLDSDGDGLENACDQDCPNLDGLNPIDLRDFSILADDWGQVVPFPAGDLNTDGVTNAHDLAILSEYWLSKCFE